MSTRNPPRGAKAKPRGGRPAKCKQPAAPTRTEKPEAVLVAAAPTPEPAPTFGTDPALVDPRRILASIAVDADAPAAARVAACKALLTADPAPAAPGSTDTPQDALTQRTLALMKRGRPN